jgi:hypothetical protein
MTKDEALRLALEALEEIGLKWPNVLKAIDAVKEALETKDEPVAWMNKHGACKTSLFREMEAGAKEEYTIPVYTTPPQRTWVKLTENQIDELEKEFIGFSVPNIYNFVQAIEAKLKEKNHGN